MKKLSLFLMLAILPHGANADAINISTCLSDEIRKNTPLGYCCASIDEVDTYLNCDDFNLTGVHLEACKTERFECIQYCMNDYEWYNGSVRCKSPDPCAGERYNGTTAFAEDCTIPHALYCSYDIICDLCGNNCRHENEMVDECDGDNYYYTEDWKQCLKCPGDGIVDGDRGNVGIAQCYIPREPKGGSDATGTFIYVPDKCYWKE